MSDLRDGRAIAGGDHRPRQAARRVGGAILVAAAVLSGCAGIGIGIGIDGDRALARRVDTIVSPLVAANQFSGAIVLSRDGRAVHQRGFGLAHRDAGLAFTPDTPADGASMAKTFTAAAVWLLVDEGRIDLDAPVTRYVPEFPHAPTTVRHLLVHSNGLPADYAFFDPHFAKDEVRTTQGLLRIVARHAPQPRFEPGTRFEYSDVGYDVAALVVERVTGQPYEAFLRERFFARLGMRHSFARTARLADWQGARTLGYRWRDGAWQPFDVFDMEAFLGASNLYFSAADLGRWGSAHALGAALPEPVRAAGQQRPVLDGRASPITALSWYCDDAAVRCHYTGILNAFHSFVHFDRARRESVAFVANGTMPPWQTITLQRQLVDALAGRPVQVEPPPSFAAFTRDTHAVVAGDYRAEGIGLVTVTHGAGGLALRVECGPSYDMFQVAGDVFYVPGTDHTIGFGAGARPATMHLRSLFVDAVLTRQPDTGPGQAGRCT